MVEVIDSLEIMTGGEPEENGSALDDDYNQETSLANELR